MVFLAYCVTVMDGFESGYNFSRYAMALTLCYVFIHRLHAMFV